MQPVCFVRCWLSCFVRSDLRTSISCCFVLSWVSRFSCRRCSSKISCASHVYHAKHACLWCRQNVADSFGSTDLALFARPFLSHLLFNLQAFQPFSESCVLHLQLHHSCGAQRLALNAWRRKITCARGREETTVRCSGQWQGRRGQHGAWYVHTAQDTSHTQTITQTHTHKTRTHPHILTFHTHTHTQACTTETQRSKTMRAALKLCLWCTCGPKACNLCVGVEGELLV